MKIHLLAVGTKMPGWVTTGFEEYRKRMPRECSIELKEIAPAHRGKSGKPEKYKTDEAKQIAAAIPKGAHLVALDERGKQWSTEELAGQLENWMRDEHGVCFLVGGPDGLHSSCRERARSVWSLGRLTLPHPLVRVLLAEQLYRAWTITQNHPYHRS